MRRQRFSQTTRFLALQACWTILRGGSVVYNVNFVHGGCDALSEPLFAALCQVNGRPLKPRDLFHGDPEPQPE